MTLLLRLLDLGQVLLQVLLLREEVGLVDVRAGRRARADDLITFIQADAFETGLGKS